MRYYNPVQQRIKDTISKMTALHEVLKYDLCPECGKDIEYTIRGSAFGENHPYICTNPDCKYVIYEKSKYEIHRKYGGKTITSCNTP